MELTTTLTPGYDKDNSFYIEERNNITSNAIRKHLKEIDKLTIKLIPDNIILKLRQQINQEVSRRNLQ